MEKEKRKIKIAVHQSDAKGNILLLLEPITQLYQNKRLTLPEGFQSDGCSVPEFLWDTVSPAIDPRTLRAGLFHDYLYRIQPEGWTRKEADQLFYDFCREDGLGLSRCLKAWMGLRAFGGFIWNRNKTEKQQDTKP